MSYLAKFADIPLGLYIVRGDNIVMLGEMDESKAKSILTEVPADELATIIEVSENSDEKKSIIWDFE